MTDSDISDTENPPNECPECGGATVKAGGTQAYDYISCVDCEWYEKVKTGRYL